jgi:hypothetical protein
MNPVTSIANQYAGINAHLHSRYQTEGGWNNFHTRHIVHIADVMAAKLLPMGYVARVEDSLQIRRLGDAPVWFRADVAVYPTGTTASRMTTSRNLTDTEFIPLLELMESDDDIDDRPFPAVAVYSARQPYETPVAWLELLSPSNKGATADAAAYRDKRRDLLETGIVFVELDYLHHTPPTFPKIPAYFTDESVQTGFPYHIVVLAPRPSYRDGEAQVIGFDVDTAVPSVDIPLMDADVLSFDFGAAYRKTFEEGVFGYDLDYRALPLAFDRYSLNGKTRIARRMLAVLEAAAAGLDLEAGAPLPTKDLPLDAALAALGKITQDIP